MLASFQVSMEVWEALEFIDCATETFRAIDYTVFHTKETNHTS